MNVENSMMNYSVIVTYRNGTVRGYHVTAVDQNEAIQKLMGHINFNLIQKFEIAEIIVEQDYIK